MERHLVWPELLNARDLGGLGAASGEQTAWRQVVRADNLNKLAPAGVTALVAYGIRTVIDLRDPRELAKFPNPLATVPPASAIAAVADASPGGVVIHCHAGKERTGIVAALLLSLAGVADETVAQDWIASDAFLQPLYEEWLANERDPTIRAKRAEGFVTHAEHIADVLTYVRRSHGSLAEYLLAGGLTADQLDLARRLLVSSGG